DGSTPHSRAAASSGSGAAPESTKTAVPPSSSATRYAFESQPGSMLFMISTPGTLLPPPAKRRRDGRADEPNERDHQGEVVEAARPRRETLRDSRLLVREAARAAAEREARSRRRHDGEEAPRAPDPAAAAERREAGDAGPRGGRRQPRGPRPARARAQ